MIPDTKQRQSTAGVLRNRNFALLWTGQSISVVGNGIFVVGLPLEVLRLTSSALDLAIVVGARTVPTVLCLLVGGAVVDRLPRRTVMLVSDSVSGAAIAVVAILIATGRVRVWELLVLSLVMGLASAFFMPAVSAIARDILPVPLLVSGSSLTSLSQSLGQYLAGPLAGGVIAAAAGTSWAFAIDAISFGVSAACLAAMRVPRAERGPRSSIVTEMREGVRYSRSQPWLWWSMLALGVANLVSFVPLMVLLALFVEKVFKADGVALGVMYAASGLGGALASLYVKRRGAPRQRVLGMWIAWVIAGLAALLMGLSPAIWLATALVAVVWGGVTYGNVLWFPLMQEKVPPDLLGRVSSLDWMISLALTPFGTVLGGALAGVIGVRLTFVAGGAIAAAMGAVLLVPGVRDPDRRKVTGQV